MITPNVNFFIHYVPSLDGLGLNSPTTKKFLEQRKFYSCDKNYNFVNYVNDGSKTKVDFVSYSGNNEKSVGVFNKDGLCDKEQLTLLKKELRETKSPIWHGLISFEENFGENYCNSYKKAFELMNKLFPKFLKNARFDPKNIEWYAGFHTNTDNRHIHFSFYEKEPMQYRKGNKQKVFSHGQVSLASIEKMKVDTELYLTSKDNLIAKQRNEITKSFKENFTKSITNKEVLKKMKKLVLIIPALGRVSYDSENMMFLKNDINYLVDKIIKSEPSTSATYRSFLTLLNDKDMSIKRMCEASKINPGKVVLFEKYQKDLYRRLGNIVIKEILKASFTLKDLDYKSKNRLVQKRIERNKLTYLIDQSLYLGEKVRQEAMSYFKEHMKVLNEMRIKVLIEQGVIDL